MALVYPTLEFTSVGCNRGHGDHAGHRINHLRLNNRLVKRRDFDFGVRCQHHELRFVQIGKVFLDVRVAFVVPTLDDAQLAHQAIVEGVLQDFEAIILAIKQIVNELGGLPCGFNVFVRLWCELDHTPVGGEGVEQQCLGGFDGVEDVAGDVLAAARLLVAQWLTEIVPMTFIALFADQTFGVSVRGVEVPLQ